MQHGAVIAGTHTTSGAALRQIMIVVGVIATIIVNMLAVTLPLNGLSTAEIAHRFDVYFLPANYVFSIWSLIYLGLIVFAIYQALPSQRDNPRLQGIGYLFALSCLANMTWIFMWHYLQLALSVVVMLVLLGSLIAIYVRLGIGRVRVPTAEKWAVHVPFSIYLGWITVATIANITDLLYDLRWDGWGISPEVWTVIVLAVATLIAVTTGLTRSDVAYLLVIVWAFVGILVNFSDVQMVAIASGVAAGVAAVTALWVAARPLLLRRQQLTVAS